MSAHGILLDKDREIQKWVSRISSNSIVHDKVYGALRDAINPESISRLKGQQELGAIYVKEYGQEHRVDADHLEIWLYACIEFVYNQAMQARTVGSAPSERTSLRIQELWSPSQKHVFQTVYDEMEEPPTFGNSEAHRDPRKWDVLIEQLKGRQLPTFLLGNAVNARARAMIRLTVSEFRPLRKINEVNEAGDSSTPRTKPRAGATGRAALGTRPGSSSDSATRPGPSARASTASHPATGIPDAATTRTGGSTHSRVRTPPTAPLTNTIQSGAASQPSTRRPALKRPRRGTAGWTDDHLWDLIDIVNARPDGWDDVKQRLELKGVPKKLIYSDPGAYDEHLRVRQPAKGFTGSDKPIREDAYEHVVKVTKKLANERYNSSLSGWTTKQMDVVSQLVNIMEKKHTPGGFEEALRQIRADEETARLFPEPEERTSHETSHDTIRAVREAISLLRNKRTVSQPAWDHIKGKTSTAARDELRGQTGTAARDELRGQTSTAARDELRGQTSTAARDGWEQHLDYLASAIMAKWAFKPEASGWDAIKSELSSEPASVPASLTGPVDPGIDDNFFKIRLMAFPLIREAKVKPEAYEFVNNARRSTPHLAPARLQGLSVWTADQIGYLVNVMNDMASYKIYGGWTKVVFELNDLYKVPLRLLEGGPSDPTLPTRYVGFELVENGTVTLETYEHVTKSRLSNTKAWSADTDGRLVAAIKKAAETSGSKGWLSIWEDIGPHLTRDYLYHKSAKWRILNDRAELLAEGDADLQAAIRKVKTISRGRKRQSSEEPTNVGLPHSGPRDSSRSRSRSQDQRATGHDGSEPYGRPGRRGKAAAQNEGPVSAIVSTIPGVELADGKKPRWEPDHKKAFIGAIKKFYSEKINGSWPALSVYLQDEGIPAALLLNTTSLRMRAWRLVRSGGITQDEFDHMLKRDEVSYAAPESDGWTEKSCNALATIMKHMKRHFVAGGWGEAIKRGLAEGIPHKLLGQHDDGKWIHATIKYAPIRRRARWLHKNGLIDDAVMKYFVPKFGSTESDHDELSDAQQGLPATDRGREQFDDVDASNKQRGGSELGRPSRSKSHSLARESSQHMSDRGHPVTQDPRAHDRNRSRSQDYGGVTGHGGSTPREGRPHLGAGPASRVMAGSVAQERSRGRTDMAAGRRNSVSTGGSVARMAIGHHQLVSNSSNTNSRASSQSASASPGPREHMPHRPAHGSAAATLPARHRQSD